MVDLTITVRVLRAQALALLLPVMWLISLIVLVGRKSGHQMSRIFAVMVMVGIWRIFGGRFTLCPLRKAQQLSVASMVSAVLLPVMAEVRVGRGHRDSLLLCITGRWGTGKTDHPGLVITNILPALLWL
ncbi:hypothetical protein AAZK65_26995 [Klebsiella pneumoniae]|uniref:hypothetical protein n=1 Tax=Klebsiella pneumoniae TaxID=573 RepID=UPI000D7259E9|nr:hypothetical protein DL506_28950 [Klebsiella pneumoniae]